MVRVTGNFTSRAPLSPEVLEAINHAFSEGWADPRKLSQSAHRAAILKAAALESISSSLAISPSALHMVGEPALLPYLAIAGLARADSSLFYSTIDQGKIRAAVTAHSGPVHRMEVDSNGAIETPSFNTDALISIQAVNGETGITQNLSRFFSVEATFVVDATHAIPKAELIPLSGAVILDAQSWGGPQGIGFLALASPDKYNYPLPKIAPINVPGSYSLPLLIGAAIALENYQAATVDRAALRNHLVAQLKLISRITVVAPDAPASPHYLSLVVSGMSADELLRSLNALGFDCDSGSACNPQLLSPSHVLNAMGIPTEGHLRICLHDGVTREEIDLFTDAIRRVLN